MFFYYRAAFSGITLAMIFQVSRKMKVSWRFGISKALKKYSRMLFVWILIIAFSGLVMKVVSSFDIIAHTPTFLFYVQFIINIFTQTLFVYSIPSIIMENKKPINSIARSFMVVKEYPMISFAVILIPSVLLIPVNYIHFKMAYLIEALFPEAVLWVLAARIMFTTAMDFIVTSSAALVLLMYKESENRGMAV